MTKQLILLNQFSCSVIPDSLWSHGLQHARPPSLYITNSQSLLKLTFIESVMPSNHLNLCCSCLLLPSIFSSIKVFPNKSVPCIRWQSIGVSYSSVSLSNKYLGLISFRFDWFYLAVHGILKSILQHHSSKPSILWLSALWSNLISIHD